jgi:GalNAc-alpha-(1->4)-GalNAc-alpha-(1->3)-diNAcBac-PP-undecaprenol alpha-1,4-N-acetyl-D-galactosaminyltransferase
MKIALFISSLQCGGAERSLSILANALVNRNCSVRIFTLAGSDSVIFYQLDSRIQLFPLDALHSSRNVLEAAIENLKRCQKLRMAIKKYSPDVAISFIDVMNIQVLLACVGLDIPVIVAERTNPEEHFIPSVWRALRKWTYSRAAKVVVQTPRVADYFLRDHNLHCEVIPNFVVTPSTFAENVETKKKVIAIGRLDECKQFDKLMNAFDRAAQHCPEWVLEIWGEGCDRPRLEAVRDSLKSAALITLPGVTVDPYIKLASSALFVLSSRFEGFPNALCEAMACGVPVISFDCPTGPREIIRNRVDGILVEPNDEDALAEAIHFLMIQPKLRNEMGKRAREIINRFGVDSVMNQWIRLIQNAI